MKSRIISTLLSALIALSMTATGFAIAQSEPDRRDHGGEGQRNNDRRGDQDHSPGSTERGDRHGDQRGAGPNHTYYKGDRLSAESRRRQYVISDWRGHHLSAPPRGYQWVQTGDDYVLAAITTGIILQLTLAH